MKLDIPQRLAAFLLLTIAALIPARAQTPLEGTAKSEAVELISSCYEPWTTVGLEGKIRSELLPLTVTARIYMERSKEILVSLRAPLLGEVARVELDNDSVTLVNKMKRTYSRISTGSASRIYPGALADLQDMLLGRLILLGNGALDAGNAGHVDILDDDSGEWAVMPLRDCQPAGATYGYTVDVASGQILQFILVREDAGDDSDSLAIDYFDGRNNGLNLVIAAILKGRQYTASIDFKAPDQSPSNPGRFVADGKYRRVTPREVMKF